MKLQLLKGAVAGLFGALAVAGMAAAADVQVGVDIATPNVRVRAGTAPPPVTVVETERVIVREKSIHHDNGKHKGHYKKHKKHKKHKKDND